MTFGYFQIGKAVPTTPWEMVANASVLTQAVLGILAFLSLLSWAVMLGKWIEFRIEAVNGFLDDLPADQPGQDAQ